MADLEQRLRALSVEWPATPDLSAAVSPRLEPRAAGRRRRRAGRWVGVAVALLLGAVAAVEPARSAVLEFLGLKSVRIERREPVGTPQPAGADLDLGRAVTQAQADRRAGFRTRPPALLGAPDGIFLDGGRVHYTYASAAGVDVLVTLFPPTTRPFIEKSVGLGARVRRFTLDGARGYFISGAEHGVAFEDPAGGIGTFEPQRLAGNTLLLERDDLLIRIEADVPFARARAIAASIPR